MADSLRNHTFSSQGYCLFCDEAYPFVRPDSPCPMSGPAKTVRDLRRMAGLSQAALAASLGVHRTTVARWETGVLPIPKWVELAFRESLIRGLIEKLPEPGAEWEYEKQEEQWINLARSIFAMVYEEPLKRLPAPPARPEAVTRDSQVIGGEADRRTPAPSE